MQILKNVKEKLRNNKAVEKLHPFFINRYLFFRYLINNLFPNSFIDRNLEIRDFKYLEFETLYNKLNIKTSPSRRLSDLFWLTLPWAKIKDEL